MKPQLSTHVRPIPVEHLVVMLDFEDEMLDVVHSHLPLAIHEQTEPSKV
jgi:hypothetical protein